MNGEKLIVPAIRDSLSIISDYVLEVAKEAGLDRKKRNNLRRAVDEIATNIIEHGYLEKKGRGILEIEATIDQSALIIFLEDTGIPYDPTQHPTPTDLESPLEERKMGGLGVYLAQISVDKLIYERVDNRNCNQLIVYRSLNKAK
ncbi:MAG: ATP-binding protein [Cyanobacteria bacterium P01_G01_bin.49]